MEFFAIPGGAKGFQVNAGVQIQGNAAREPVKSPKHPMRVVFKGDYGPASLSYKVFPDSPVTKFDTLILRADFNFSWIHWDSHQRSLCQKTRDAWMKDTMRAMGGMASHNRDTHLFINGVYWGIYEPSERPDGGMAAAYLGGQKEDYDVVNEGAAVDGTMVAYNAGGRRANEWVKAYGDPRKAGTDVVDWIERIPFTETRNYVQRVSENLTVYRARFAALTKPAPTQPTVPPGDARPVPVAATETPPPIALTQRMGTN